MSNVIKDLSIKNQTYYIFDDIINTKIPMQIILKQMKNFRVYYLGFVTIKDSKYVKTNSVNSFDLIFSKMNGYLEEINKNKYLTLVPTN